MEIDSIQNITDFPFYCQTGENFASSKNTMNAWKKSIYKQDDDTQTFQLAHALSVEWNEM